MNEPSDLVIDYKENPFGIMYHHFHSHEIPAYGQGSINSDDFKRTLDLAGDRLVDANVWIDRAVNNSLTNEVCITFDDALMCQYEIALPVLAHYNIQAIFFVYSGVFDLDYLNLGSRDLKIENSDLAFNMERYRHFRVRNFSNVDEFYTIFFSALESSSYSTEVRNNKASFDEKVYLAEYSVYSTIDRWFRFVRDEILGPKKYDSLMSEIMAGYAGYCAPKKSDIYMSNDCLEDLVKKNQVLGLHSCTHPMRIGHMSFDQQNAEYRLNAEHLKSFSNHNINVASHPSNSYSQDTLNIFDALGVAIAFRADMSSLARRSSYELPRMNHLEWLGHGEK